MKMLIAVFACLAILLLPRYLTVAPCRPPPRYKKHDVACFRHGDSRDIYLQNAIYTEEHYYLVCPFHAARPMTNTLAIIINMMIG
jgi:hypothetical protein